MYARYAVTCEHVRDVGEASNFALKGVGRGIQSATLGSDIAALPNAVERVLGIVGDAAAKGARGVLVECAAGRIRRLGVDVRQFESLGIVVRGVAAAVVNGNGVVLGNLVEVVDSQLPSVFEFGV